MNHQVWFGPQHPKSAGRIPLCISSRYSAVFLPVSPKYEGRPLIVLQHRLSLGLVAGIAVSNARQVQIVKLKLIQTA